MRRAERYAHQPLDDAAGPRPVEAAWAFQLAARYFGRRSHRQCRGYAQPRRPVAARRPPRASRSFAAGFRPAVTGAPGRPSSASATDRTHAAATSASRTNPARSASGAHPAAAPTPLHPPRPKPQKPPPGCRPPPATRSRQSVPRLVAHRSPRPPPWPGYRGSAITTRLTCRSSPARRPPALARPTASGGRHTAAARCCSSPRPTPGGHPSYQGGVGAVRGERAQETHTPEAGRRPPTGSHTTWAFWSLR